MTRARSIHSGKTTRPGRRTLSTPKLHDATRLSSGFAQAATAFGFQSEGAPSAGKQVLAQDDLFHSYTNSPIPDIRQRAAFMRQHAYCPCPDHRPARLTESGQPLRQSPETAQLPPAHVDFECPDCGIPVYCSKEHWMADYEAHLEVCDTLRQINEDDHDLRSGRFFPEFEYAGPQLEEAMVNMTNWDTFLYTRNFQAINSDRSMRQATRILTYPITVGSILHELSPYTLRQDSRLTPEGLKSMSGMSLFLTLIVSKILMLLTSSTVYTPPTKIWRRYGGQEPPPRGTSRAPIHPRRTRRILPAA